MRPFNYLACAALLTLVFGGQCRTQPGTENPKVRLALTYEQGGKYEEAARLYEELRASDPSNIVFFDGLRRMYLQLKRYDEVIALIRERLATSPRDVMLLCHLGSALYKAGRETEAYTEWDRARSVDPGNAGYYRTIAASLIENRLLEKTAELYRQARTATGNPNLFTVELAQLLASSMNYRDATLEYVRWLRTNPGQLAFVEGKMSTFTGRDEGRAEAIKVVRAELEQEETLQLTELLAWLYLDQKEYSLAWAVYREIDRMANAGGARILAFADLAFREGAFRISSEAYLEAINHPVQEAVLPAAKYGYASCLKELGVLSDSSAHLGASTGNPSTEAMPMYTGAIEHFRQIIRDHPGTEYAARSYYQIGLIQYERFFDLDGALQSFQAVEDGFPERNTIYYAVSLRMGEVETAKSDTVAAAARYRQAANAPQATPDQQDEATYRLAELLYFRGEFQKAEELLGSLTLNLQADYANDALRLLAFLQENSSSAGEALREYAAADYLARRQRPTEAIPVFLSIIDRYPRAPLVDDALMEVGTLQSAIGEYENALAAYDRLLKEFSETSIALDNARFATAEIYEFRMRDKARAIQEYEQLLIDHPNSLHADEARRRIRQLRGETL